MPFVVPLAAAGDLLVAGGKAARLGEMLRDGQILRVDGDRGVVEVVG